MGYIIGNRIDYNGVGALRGQLHIPTKDQPKYPPPPPPHTHTPGYWPCDSAQGLPFVRSCLPLTFTISFLT